LDTVSTTCDSGWVDDQHPILLRVDPPAIAGGTDCVQVGLSDFWGKAHVALLHLDRLV